MSLDQGYAASPPPPPPADLGIPGIIDPLVIGHGGFGVVYRARRPGFDQTVAVKVLLDPALDQEARRRFEREVRAMGALFGHPHIVGIINAGYTSHEQPYIVMEDMAGGSLADSLRARGRIPWEEATAVGVALAGALEAAHAANVLHRDVKPENVLYSRYGEAKLADFGIASLGDGAQTRSTTVHMSPAYTSPEVLDGAARSPSSDVYALAATILAVIWGQPPFAASGDESLAAVFKRITADPPPDLRTIGVPDAVCRVLERALSKAPGDRFQSATQFREQLERARQVSTAGSGRGAPGRAAPTWRLSIDFGTTYSAAAVADESRATLLTVEGDGSPRMRSAVWLDDAGTLLVGAAAVNQYWLAPERFEPTPKRLIGQRQALLGDTAVPVVDLVAAVLRAIVEEAARQHGGDAPGEARLTHPAGWAATRSAVLVEAARQAGLTRLKLVPEPVAAAFHISRARRIAVDEHVAVYDFGGGTFDAAVLRRTPDGFEVAGPPGGKDPMGGEDIDQKIVDYLGAGPLGTHPEWPNLIAPPDTRWRQRQADLYAWVRRAKEALSSQMAFTLFIPGVEQNVQLTRPELEELIRSDIEETVEILRATIVAAGISTDPGELAGIYLVGGSSRIPLVAQTVWQRLGRQPDTQDDPKSVVALGGAEWGAALSTPVDATSAAPATPAARTPEAALVPPATPSPAATPPAPAAYQDAATVAVPPTWTPPAAATPARAPEPPAQQPPAPGRPRRLRSPLALALAIVVVVAAGVGAVVLATRCTSRVCSGPAPTLTPAATHRVTTPIPALAVGDSCVVGDWSDPGPYTLNFPSVSFSGTVTGVSLAIAANGTEVYDWSSASFDGSDSAGDDLTADASGTVTFQAHAAAGHWTESGTAQPVTWDFTETYANGGGKNGSSTLGQSGASVAYTCSSSQLRLGGDTYLRD